jgi:hypothetical protein
MKITTKPQPETFQALWATSDQTFVITIEVEKRQLIRSMEQG